MSAFFFFRLTVTLARRRSKRGIFFLPVATMPCHLKANLICLSSRDFPAPFPLREQVVPSLPWMPGNGPAPPPTPPPGAESGRREDQRVGAATVTQVSYFTFLLPFRCRTRGIHQWANFLVRAPGKDRGSENLIKSDLRPKEKMASTGTPISCRLVLASCVQHLHSLFLSSQPHSIDINRMDDKSINGEEVRFQKLQWISQPLQWKLKDTLTHITFFFSCNCHAAGWALLEFPGPSGACYKAGWFLVASEPSHFPITSLIPTSKDRSVGKSLFRKIYIQMGLPTVVKPFSSFWIVGGPVLSEPICVALSLRVNSGPLNTQ